jgi:hypothetical protein
MLHEHKRTRNNQKLRHGLALFAVFPCVCDLLQRVLLPDAALCTSIVALLHGKVTTRSGGGCRGLTWPQRLFLS